MASLNGRKHELLRKKVRVVMRFSTGTFNSMRKRAEKAKSVKPYQFI